MNFEILQQFIEAIMYFSLVAALGLPLMAIMDHFNLKNKQR